MPTQKEIDAALKALAQERERNDHNGRYATQEEEIRTVLAAAEKARLA